MAVPLSLAAGQTSDYPLDNVGVLGVMKRNAVRSGVLRSRLLSYNCVTGPDRDETSEISP